MGEPVVAGARELDALAARQLREFGQGKDEQFAVVADSGDIIMGGGDRLDERECRALSRRHHRLALARLGDDVGGPDREAAPVAGDDEQLFGRARGQEADDVTIALDVDLCEATIAETPAAWTIVRTE